MPITTHPSTRANRQSANYRSKPAPTGTSRVLGLLSLNKKPEAEEKPADAELDAIRKTVSEVYLPGVQFTVQAEASGFLLRAFGGNVVTDGYLSATAGANPETVLTLLFQLAQQRALQVVNSEFSYQSRLLFSVKRLFREITPVEVPTIVKPKTPRTRKPKVAMAPPVVTPVPMIEFVASPPPVREMKSDFTFDLAPKEKEKVVLILRSFFPGVSRDNLRLAAVNQFPVVLSKKRYEDLQTALKEARLLTTVQFWAGQKT